MSAQSASRGKNSPVRLIFLGWLERDKGIFELIEACRRLAASHGFTLTSQGRATASAEARELVTRHELTEVIQFRGWLRGEQLRRALREADVLVLPSWAEGLAQCDDRGDGGADCGGRDPRGGHSGTDHATGAAECWWSRATPTRSPARCSEIIADRELRSSLARGGLSNRRARF